MVIFVGVAVRGASYHHVVEAGCRAVATDGRATASFVRSMAAKTMAGYAEQGAMFSSVPPVRYVALLLPLLYGCCCRSIVQTQESLGGLVHLAPLLPTYIRTYGRACVAATRGWCFNYRSGSSSDPAIPTLKRLR